MRIHTFPAILQFDRTAELHMATILLACSVSTPCGICHSQGEAMKTASISFRFQVLIIGGAIGIFNRRFFIVTATSFVLQPSCPYPDRPLQRSPRRYRLKHLLRGATVLNSSNHTQSDGVFFLCPECFLRRSRQQIMPPCKPGVADEFSCGCNFPACYNFETNLKTDPIN